MTFAHGETVTRLRAPLVTDPYSSDATERDWSNAAELNIPNCGVAASGSVEPLEAARQAVDSDFDLYLPTGTDVTAQDRLRVRGLVCEVVGRPFAWQSPLTGWQPGVVAHCKVREG